MEIKSKNVSNRVLTGITTTGAPHLGNYVGAIRPAIEASKEKMLIASSSLRTFMQ